MNGDIQRFLQRVDGKEHGHRVLHTGHILKVNGLDAHVHIAFRDIDIEFVVMCGAGGVEQVGGDLLAGLQRRADRRLAVASVHQSVEDQELVDPGLGGAVDKVFYHIVGILVIAYNILPAQDTSQYCQSRPYPSW